MATLDPDLAVADAGISWRRHGCHTKWLPAAQLVLAHEWLPDLGLVWNHGHMSVLAKTDLPYYQIHTLV